MLIKIKKLREGGSLIVLMVSGIFFFNASQCAASKTENCHVGMYPLPPEERHLPADSVRTCYDFNGVEWDCWLCSSEKQCYDAVENHFKPAVNFYGVRRWELFYNNYNGDLKQSCEQWRDKCPNCDANGKPVVKGTKNPSVKKDEHPLTQQKQSQKRKN